MIKFELKEVAKCIEKRARVKSFDSLQKLAKSVLERVKSYKKCGGIKNYE